LKVDRDFQADKNGVQARSRADVAGRKAQSLILKLNDLRVFELTPLAAEAPDYITILLLPA
jgi:hypothetical protein